MEKTIEIAGWRGRLNAGLPPRQLEALLWSAADMKIKEIARRMNISPGTTKEHLVNARQKLGEQRTVRGLCLEAMRRGIIAPLMLALCAVLAGNQHQTTFVRRPVVQRTAQRCIRAEYVRAP